MKSSTVPKYGKIFLVGAGPGDPKLLTIRALEVLRIADVILYDRLVSSEILELLPENTRKINVGKVPHTSEAMSLEQKEINRIMLEESKKGNKVVRLKGGDPLFFSRGGEELDEIREEGIEYEVVPGVSSAIGVPSFAGLPLTQRGVASSVAFVTGHEDPSKEESRVDLRKLATAVDTIVVLMGAAKLHQITEELISGGARIMTPVAVVESGTRPDQKVRFSTLGEIAEGDLGGALRSPALIVVGDVLRSKIGSRVRRSGDEEDLEQIPGEAPQKEEKEEETPISWCIAAEFS